MHIEPGYGKITIYTPSSNHFYLEFFMNTEALKKYLSVCIDLEREKYTQMKIIQQLSNNISACQKEINANNAYLAKMSRNEDILSVSGSSLTYEYRITPELIKTIEGKAPNKLLKPFIIYYFAALGAIFGILMRSILFGVIGVVAGFIFGIVISGIICRKIKESRRSKIVQNAERIMNEQTAQIINRTNINNRLSVMLPNYETIKKNMLSVHNLTVQTLDKYYAKNIIPRKYCELVPICMFYDYLINLRTYSLERRGADEGAINMYEDECYKRLILSKLDTIIDRLDEISSNQGVLYRAISEGNDKTQRMMQSINGNISSVNQNLQFIQYQNEQIRKCAEYSTYSW